MLFEICVSTLVSFVSVRSLFPECWGSSFASFRDGWPVGSQNIDRGEIMTCVSSFDATFGALPLTQSKHASGLYPRSIRINQVGALVVYAGIPEVQNIIAHAHEDDDVEVGAIGRVAQ